MRCVLPGSRIRHDGSPRRTPDAGTGWSEDQPWRGDPRRRTPSVRFSGPRKAEAPHPAPYWTLFRSEIVIPTTLPSPKRWSRYAHGPVHSDRFAQPTCLNVVVPRCFALHAAAEVSVWNPIGQSRQKAAINTTVGTRSPGESEEVVIAARPLGPSVRSPGLRSDRSR